MSAGKKGKAPPVLFTQSTSNDYEQLCALDVLGLADTNESGQQAAYTDFKETL